MSVAASTAHSCGMQSAPSPTQVFLADDSAAIRERGTGLQVLAAVRTPGGPMQVTPFTTQPAPIRFFARDGQLAPMPERNTQCSGCHLKDLACRAGWRRRTWPGSTA
jgi:hypothetical protein